MQEQQLNRIIQKRIFWTFAGVTLFFLVLLLLLLPYGFILGTFTKPVRMPARFQN